MQIYLTYKGNEFEITSSVLSSFPFDETVDHTLDTASLVLPNVLADEYSVYGLDLSQRIECMSKIRIVIEEEEFAYYIAQDDIREIRMLAPKLYEHKLVLIEQTKLLKKKTIPDITITQPSADTTLVTSTLINSTTLNDLNKVSNNITLSQTFPSNDVSVINVAQLVEQYQPDGVTLQEYDVFVNVEVQHNSADDIDLEVRIKKNGTEVSYETANVFDIKKAWYSLVTIIGVLFPKTTSATVKAEPLTIGATPEDITIDLEVIPNIGVGWSVDITTTVTIQAKVTSSGKSIYANEVIQKMLDTTEIKDLNDSTTTPRFKLDPVIDELASGVLVPEQTINRTNLFEGLNQIGDLFQGIVRLKDFDTITYDIYDDLSGENRSEFDAYTSKTKSLNVDNYVSGVEINADNVVETANNLNTIRIPGNDRRGTVRPEGEGSIELKEDNATFKAEVGIYYIKNFWIYNVPVVFDDATTITEPWDIAPFIVTDTVYNSLTDYTLTTDAQRQDPDAIGKGNVLYYTRGDEKGIIKNLGYKAKNRTTPFGLNADRERALYEAIYKAAAIKYPSKTIDDDGNDNIEKFENVQWDAIIQTKDNVRGKIFAQNARSFDEPMVRFMNENGLVIDAEYLGDKAVQTINKSNKETEKIGGTAFTLGDIPKVGDILPGNRIVTSRSVTWNPIEIKFTLDLHKDFTYINDQINIDSARRDMEISNKQITLRQDNYNEFMVFDTLDRNANHTIYTEDGLELMMSNFFPSITLDTNLYSVPSYMEVKTREDRYNPTDPEWTTYDREVELSVNPISLGTTLLMKSKFKDNYSAGEQLEDTTGSTDYKLDGLDFIYQEDVPYTDSVGRIDSIKYALYTKRGQVSDVVDSNLSPEYVNDIKSNRIKVSEIDYRVNKDARERLAYTQQVSFTPEDTSLIVYGGFAKYNGFSVDQSVIDLQVVLLNDNYLPGPNTKYVDLSKVTEANIIDDTMYAYSTTSGKRVKCKYKIQNATAPTENTIYNGWALLKVDKNNSTKKELIYAHNVSILMTPSNYIYDDTFYVIPNAEFEDYSPATPLVESFNFGDGSATNLSQFDIVEYSISNLFPPDYFDEGGTFSFSIDNAVDFNITNTTTDSVFIGAVGANGSCRVTATSSVNNVEKFVDIQIV